MIPFHEVGGSFAFPWRSFHPKDDERIRESNLKKKCINRFWQNRLLEIPKLCFYTKQQSPPTHTHTYFVLPIFSQFPSLGLLHSPSTSTPASRAGSNCQTILATRVKGADKEFFSTAPFSQEACIQLKDFN